MSTNTERAQPYDRSTCKWTCCVCGDNFLERDMALVQGESDLDFEEPDWACSGCLTGLAEEGVRWTEYCQDCWHVMEFVKTADFHVPTVDFNVPSGRPAPCPLSLGPLVGTARWPR